MFVELVKEVRKEILTIVETTGTYIPNGNFVRGYFPKRWKGVKLRNVATDFEGSSQFHCYWRISALIKSSSFLSIKNVRSVSRIWGPNDKKKVAEINSLLK